MPRESAWLRKVGEKGGVSGGYLTSGRPLDGFRGTGERLAVEKEKAPLTTGTAGLALLRSCVREKTGGTGWQGGPIFLLKNTRINTLPMKKTGLMGGRKKRLPSNHWSSISSCLP